MTYEKPVAEIIDFANEEIMNDPSVDGKFSVSGGAEEGAPGT